MTRTNKDLIADLRRFFEEINLQPRSKPLKSWDDVLGAMEQIDRYKYVTGCEFPCYPERAYTDQFVNIALGSGNPFDKIVSPQPSFLAFWTSELDFKPGYKVLEVGTGIGYHAAIVAKLIHPDGNLVTLEVRKDLFSRAKRNLSEHNPELQNVQFIIGDGTLGYPDEAPFDRIYLTACVGQNFDEGTLLKQLQKKGILLYPTPYDPQTSLMNLIYKDGKRVRRERYRGPRFSPLIGKNSGF
jgi:protein-L-isoaspartate(D-aspartate) O-methyltransferase